MHKLLAGLLALAMAFSAQAQRLEVAATPVPHAEILEVVKEQLASQGIELKVRVFTDYVQPNVQVAEGNLQANFFQHQPYLDDFNASRKSNLVSAAGIHIEPFGAYSKRINSLEQLSKGAQVAIPNDPTNGGRALLLLQKAGLITLKEGVGTTATRRDIIENPKDLRIRELEAAILPRVLDQMDLALINTNYALEAGLDPSKDALVIEGSESPYVNILVVREDSLEAPEVQALIKALQSEAVRSFIQDKYQGAVVPAF